MEEFQDLIVLHTSAGQSNVRVNETEKIWVWSRNSTKILLDLYKENKPKVGTRTIKNLKRLWEIIADELNKILGASITPGQCENKWRVLERAYKKHIDNQSKTGQGRKYFEYSDEMDEIFKGKRNVKPTLVLSSNTVDEPVSFDINQVEEEMDISHSTNIRIETEKDISLPSTSTDMGTANKSLTKPATKSCSTKQKRNPLLNRNTILSHMRNERREYNVKRLALEQEKLEVHKQKLDLMKERNTLLKQRNEILKNKCVENA